MPASTQNAYKLVLNKPLPYQRGYKMYLNMCWPIPLKDSKDTKCISTCVKNTPPIPARTQNASHYVLTKMIHCQQVHKMHVNTCWPNPTHASENTSILTCVVQTPPMPASTQDASQQALTKVIQMLVWTHNVSQIVLTKPNPFHRIHKMHLNTWWSEPSLASEDIKCISTCLLNPSHNNEDTKCISTCVGKTLKYQR